MTDHLVRTLDHPNPMEYSSCLLKLFNRVKLLTQPPPPLLLNLLEILLGLLIHLMVIPLNLDWTNWTYSSGMGAPPFREGVGFPATPRETPLQPRPETKIKIAGQNKSDTLESFQFRKAILKQHDNTEQ